MSQYLQRVNETVIYNSFNSTMVSAVIGARRVGKSTLVQHYVQMHQDKVWVNFSLDYRSQRVDIRNEKLVSMIEESAEQKIGGQHKIWVVIDEAQKCDEVFEQIKIIYDEFKGQDKIKFILTGSAQLTLRQRCAETLAGRIELFDLREFGIHEAALINRPDISLPRTSVLRAIFDGQEVKTVESLVQEVAPLRKVYESVMREELIWGGLPECLEFKNEESRITYLRNYLDTYFEKDIRMLATISDLNLYQRLMKISAEQTGSVRDDQKIMDALGCSRETLKKYRGYLSATMMFEEVFPFIANTMKRIVKSPKGYLTNNGLISYFSGIYSLDALESVGGVGHRFENTILKQLQIALDQSPKESKLYFYQTHGGFEVDFIVECVPRCFAIEVTYGNTPKRKKQKHLVELMGQEKKIGLGIYIYNGECMYDSKTNILYLPSWATF